MAFYTEKISIIDSEKIIKNNCGKCKNLVKRMDKYMNF